MTKLAVAVVNYNTKDLTLTCLKTIFENTQEKSLQVWVVDNGSSDGSVAAIKEKFPKVKVIENKDNVGFAKANNQVLTQADAQFYLLLNSDTEVKKGALDILLKEAEEKGYGIASPKLLNKDGSLQPNAGELPFFLPMLLWLSGLDDLISSILPVKTYHYKQGVYGKNLQTVGWVGGTAMLIRRDVVEKVGKLDEKIFMYAEDVDYCWRATKKGFTVGWVNDAAIIHLGGASSQSPRLAQWLGEFKGLVYLYGKYYGSLPQLGVRVLFKLFSLLRAIAYTILGRGDFAKIYAKICITV